MNKQIDNVMPGQEFGVRVFAGKDGNVISRLPDGRPLLFGQQFIMTAKLHTGDIVKVRVIKPADTYVLVQPIRLMNESELQPNNEFEPAPTGPEVVTHTIDAPSMPQTPVKTPKSSTALIDQFIETVPSYKCKVCNNVINPRRSVIERHIAEEHNVQYG